MKSFQSGTGHALLLELDELEELLLDEEELLEELLLDEEELLEELLLEELLEELLLDELLEELLEELLLEELLEELLLDELLEELLEELLLDELLEELLEELLLDELLLDEEELLEELLLEENELLEELDEELELLLDDEDPHDPSITSHKNREHWHVAPSNGAWLIPDLLAIAQFPQFPIKTPKMCRCPLQPNSSCRNFRGLVCGSYSPGKKAQLHANSAISLPHVASISAKRGEM